MKAGDLVIRVWARQPRWDMIGIIIREEFVVLSAGSAEWTYRIMWSKNVIDPRPNRHPLNQKWNEINGYFIADSSEYFTKGTFRWWKVPVEVIRWLYETDSWEHKERTGKFAGRGLVMHQWGVKRPIDNFLVTMEKLFTK